MTLTARMSNLIKTNFLTGIAMLFPLFITMYLIVVIFKFIDGLAGKHINSYLLTHYELTIPGLGLIVLVVLTLGAGFLYNYLFGRKFWPLIEQLFYRTPFVSNIYPSAKELSQFLFKSKEEKRFEKVVSVEFPSKGTYSIGFITNEKIGELDVTTEKELVSVFVPLAPTPISGHILLVPRNKIRELNISIDRALKFVISGGVVLTEYH